MLEACIISQIESSWTSPTTLETKNDEGPGFWIDLRKSSAVIENDKWPVPSFEDIFDDLRDSSISPLSIFSRLLSDQDGWNVQREKDFYI